MATSRNVKWTLGIATVVLCLILGTFYQHILMSLGDFLILSQTPEASDIVLVLAGDFFGTRILAGAGLAARGYAKHVLISGTPYQNTYECDLAVRFAGSQGYSPDLFLTARHHARSTIEEAITLEPELRRLGARRILLVTSDYHSRRAALVFRLFLPGFEFRTVAAPDKHLQPMSWWKTEQGRHLVFSEYSKMFGTLIALLVKPVWSAQPG